MRIFKPLLHHLRKGATFPLTRVLVVSILLAHFATACATSGYWIPPNSSPTPPANLAFLFNTPIPVAETQQVDTSDPTPTPNQEKLPPPTQVVEPSPTALLINTAPILYYTQAADTLPVVAVRFGVQPQEITSPDPLPENSLLPPNQLLIIPRHLMNTTTSQRLLPDSEVVYSPSATDFDVEAFAQQAGGYLSTHQDWLQSTKTTSGAAIVKRVALENSINPRLLLALLEYQSNWVYGQPKNQAEIDYPLGFIDPNEKGLYRQLVWAVNHLSVGYYSWREGRLLDVRFSDGVSARLAPDLNAGSVALQYFFSQISDSESWIAALDMETGFPALYERMYGNPWSRAQTVEPLYPPGLTQPELILPFDMERLWSFSGGPHGAWEHDGSYAALDFAPASSESGCQNSNAWVVASASGLVVRSGGGLVVLDLDGDGHEQTGWVLLFLHVSNASSAPVGTWVGKGDHLGHPSCEGGLATGTHVHMARKYNGEWIAADGPMPFVLSGWKAHAGEAAYKGTLTRNDQVITACTCGSFDTRIMRTPDDPY
jgi:LasA protease